MSWEFTVESEDGDGFSFEIGDELYEKMQIASKKKGIPLEQFIIKVMEDKMKE